MAARRSGFTPWLTCEANCGCGVFAPVPAGVERFDGSSEVKIVADDGEIMYLLLSVAMSASLKPVVSVSFFQRGQGEVYLPLSLAPLPTMIRESQSSLRRATWSTDDTVR